MAQYLLPAGAGPSSALSPHSPSSVLPSSPPSSPSPPSSWPGFSSHSRCYSLSSSWRGEAVMATVYFVILSSDCITLPCIHQDPCHSFYDDIWFGSLTCDFRLLWYATMFYLKHKKNFLFDIFQTFLFPLKFLDDWALCNTVCLVVVDNEAVYINININQNYCSKFWIVNGL